MSVQASSQQRYVRRKAVNAIGISISVLAVVVALIPLGAMIYYILQQGGSYLRPSFFTNLPAPVGEVGGGMLSAISGTVELMALASLFGLPIGILSGIYLSRSNNRFADTVRFFTDVIAGTPSIVAGVVAYALIVIPMHSFSAFSGGVALALLMFPTVARATEEAIRLVPTVIREAALALGLPEWKTMLRIILPTASSGIVTAVMLGIARVAGETAPLLFTALGSDALRFNPRAPVDALPIRIWNYAQSPYEDWHRQAWEGALVLFLLIVVLNLSARMIVRRLQAKTGAI